MDCLSKLLLDSQVSSLFYFDLFLLLLLFSLLLHFHSLIFGNKSGCSSRIQEAVANITSLLGTPSGRQSLQKIFNLCTPLADGFYFSVFIICKNVNFISHFFLQMELMIITLSIC